MAVMTQTILLGTITITKKKKSILVPRNVQSHIETQAYAMLKTMINSQCYCNIVLRHPVETVRCVSVSVSA